MELDRYSTGTPGFRVFRLVGQATEGSTVTNGYLLPTSIRDEEGQLWAQVDPWECFVLKRRDAFVQEALRAYAHAAEAAGQQEAHDGIMRLARHWERRTRERGDEKLQD
jgi:hypothetical protein